DDPQDEPTRLQFRSETTYEETVRSVQDGVYLLHIEAVENETRTSLDGEAAEETEELGDPERVRINDRGKVIERRSLGKPQQDTGLTSPLDEFAILQQAIDAVALPAKDVDPGHTWVERLKVDLTPRSENIRTLVDVEVRNKFERVVLLNGQECAELVTDF